MGFKEERTLINLRRMPGTKQSIVKHMPENFHEPAFFLSMLEYIEIIYFRNTRMGCSLSFHVNCMEFIRLS